LSTSHIPVNNSVSSIHQFIHAQTALNTDALQEQLQRTLRTIRVHLGMDVAFISEFKDGRRYFNQVDSANSSPPIKVGGSDPLDESYCKWIVEGRLPEIMQDARKVPGTEKFPATALLPVGAHLSVPIRLKDGRVFGTFCCFSYSADPTLNDRDHNMLRVFAQIATELIAADQDARHAFSVMKGRIEDVMAEKSIHMVYQPIHEVMDNKLVGFESLARFTTTPMRTPDVWFNEAAQVGLGMNLEFHAIALALQGLSSLPQNLYVSINASPDTLIKNDLVRELVGCPVDRIVLEVTEHATIDVYSEISTALAPLRNIGLRLAIDDVGAGYASFRHILNLDPDIIKLDMSITRNIHSDSTRRALASALVRFAGETHCEIVAEGIETDLELTTLRDLGVDKAQGYFLGKPMSLANASEHAQARPHYNA